MRDSKVVCTDGAKMPSNTAYASCAIDYSYEGNFQKRTQQNIPYVILQTFKTRHVPISMYNAIHSWIDKNPEYSHEFFDDDRVADYIKSDFPCENFQFSRAELLRAFQAIKPGAGKADLFRYLIVFDKGGVYMDVDTFCLNPLRTFLRGDDHVLTGIGQRGDFHQWGLIYVSRHPFMRRAIENTVFNILNRRFIFGYRTLEGIGGPPCLDQSIKEVLNLPLNSRFMPGTYGFDYGTQNYRVRILNGDFFGRNVGFKYQEYDLDLQRMGIKYWDQEELFND